MGASERVLTPPGPLSHLGCRSEIPTLVIHIFAQMLILLGEETHLLSAIYTSVQMCLSEPLPKSLFLEGRR